MSDFDYKTAPLVDALRQYPKDVSLGYNGQYLMREAATEIERLNARFKVLQESLHPTVDGYITESHRIKDEITAALYGEASDE